jgi:DNA-binding XRE family transcriptional regulator
LAPTDTAVTPLVRPVTRTGTGLLVVAETFPSWAPSLAPQHWTPPPAVTAQAVCDPTDKEVTPLVRPVTCTGTELLGVVAELTPRSPSTLPPQHRTPPPAVTAQAERFPPTDTAVAVAAPPVPADPPELPPFDPDPESPFDEEEPGGVPPSAGTLPFELEQAARAATHAASKSIIRNGFVIAPCIGVSFGPQFSGTIAKQAPRSRSSFASPASAAAHIGVLYDTYRQSAPSSSLGCVKVDASTRRKLSEIGELLRTARERARVSQAALAEHIQMRRENVIRIEKGRANVTIDTLVRIASGLGLDLHVTLRRRRAT